MRILMVSTYPPRVCGIATFASDLRKAVLHGGRVKMVDILAVQQQDDVQAQAPEVVHAIPAGDPESFRDAAVFCNEHGYDVVVVQHEFGIFGGLAGRHILEFVDRVTAPVVTIAHTVLADPADHYRSALHDLGIASAKVIALTSAAAPMLSGVHEVPTDRINVIPHGVPDVPFDDPNGYKEAVGLQDHRVVLTFGLLSRNKGIEQVLDALPKVVATCPDLRYIVLGATHPEVRRQEGETYRRSLQERVERLDLTDNVEFRNQYVDDETLIAYLQASDVYVTPYQSLEQITSGTLAYAVGMGRAVVSTPYHHARDLLDDGRGILVPIGDTMAMGEAIESLLTDDSRRLTIRHKAYAYGRSMTWPQVGRDLVEVLVDTVRSGPIFGASLAAMNVRQQAIAQTDHLSALLNIAHLEALTDDVGVLQHATHGVPDRRFGYATDDQSRALIAAVYHHRATGDAASRQLAGKTLSFMQLAQQPDGVFRNCMDYARVWLDDGGTQDTLGQSVWALGVTAADGPTIGTRRLATQMLISSLPAVRKLVHPRSVAYALCGLTHVPLIPEVREIATALIEQLVDAFARERRPGWDWCDQSLSYANVKIPEALLRAGATFARDECTRLGRESLECVLNATRDGDRFDFIGNESWRTRAGTASVYAQQPIEAGYTAQACVYAAAVTGETRYRELAEQSVAWLLGNNRLGVALYDPATGICADGLERTGISMNTGAESVICALLGVLALMDEHPAMSVAAG